MGFIVPADPCKVVEISKGDSFYLQQRLATHTETVLDVRAKLEVPFVKEQLVLLWEHLCRIIMIT
jgi:hypothetical protein